MQQICVPLLFNINFFLQLFLKTMAVGSLIKSDFSKLPNLYNIAPLELPGFSMELSIHFWVLISGIHAVLFLNSILSSKYLSATVELRHAACAGFLQSPHIYSCIDQVAEVRRRQYPVKSSGCPKLKKQFCLEFFPTG